MRLLSLAGAVVLLGLPLCLGESVVTLTGKPHQAQGTQLAQQRTAALLSTQPVQLSSGRGRAAVWSHGSWCRAADVQATAQGADEARDVCAGKNFDSVIKDNSFVLSEFYASWCGAPRLQSAGALDVTLLPHERAVTQCLCAGHCKKLAPEYEKAAGASASPASASGDAPRLHAWLTHAELQSP